MELKIPVGYRDLLKQVDLLPEPRIFGARPMVIFMSLNPTRVVRTGGILPHHLTLRMSSIINDSLITWQVLAP